MGQEPLKDGVRPGESAEAERGAGCPDVEVKNDVKCSKEIKNLGSFSATRAFSLLPTSPFLHVFLFPIIDAQSTTRRLEEGQPLTFSKFPLCSVRFTKRP